MCIKTLPTAHTVSSIHRLHNRRWVNSEKVTINSSIRWFKMTNRYLCCWLKHAVDKFEGTNSTWCWSSILKKDLGSNFGRVTILQPWANLPRVKMDMPYTWKKGRTAGTTSWCEPAKIWLRWDGVRWWGPNRTALAGNSMARHIKAVTADSPFNCGTATNCQSTGCVTACRQNDQCACVYMASCEGVV